MRRLAITVVALGLALAACGKKRDSHSEAETSPSAIVSAPEPLAVPPIPTDPGPAPALPAFAQALDGRSLAEAFPNPGECMAAFDAVMQVFTGEPAGFIAGGWAWNTSKKAAYNEILFVDGEGVIRGGAVGGTSRSDVKAANPEQVTEETVGWNGVGHFRSGVVRAYALDSAAKTVCLAGEKTLP